MQKIVLQDDGLSAENWDRYSGFIDKCEGIVGVRGAAEVHGVSVHHLKPE